MSKITSNFWVLNTSSKSCFKEKELRNRFEIRFQILFWNLAEDIKQINLLRFPDLKKVKVSNMKNCPETGFQYLKVFEEFLLRKDHSSCCNNFDSQETSINYKYHDAIVLLFKLYSPFLWMGFNCLKATDTLRRQFTFYHSVPRNSWYSFYQPRKDERLSRPWSHPVALSTELLDWESSALTTRP